MDTRSSAYLPPYRRARGYRIYGENGDRFLDFYQDGGHAILGHRNSGVILEMKNLLSRGQIAPYPSRMLPLTVKAVETLFPGAAEVRVYRNEERAFAAAESHLKEPILREKIGDPGLPGRCSGNLVLWRPFLEAEPLEAAMMLPVFPISAVSGPAVLIFNEKPSSSVPPSEECPPFLLAALKKSIFELIRYVHSHDRSSWSEFDLPSIWSRKGPYLTLNIHESEFVSLFCELREKGILLSPRYPGPSIIPGEFSPGELACVLRVLRGRVG